MNIKFITVDRPPINCLLSALMASDPVLFRSRRHRAKIGFDRLFRQSLAPLLNP